MDKNQFIDERKNGEEKSSKEDSVTVSTIEKPKNN